MKLEAANDLRSTTTGAGTGTGTGELSERRRDRQNREAPPSSEAVLTLAGHFQPKPPTSRTFCRDVTELVVGGRGGSNSSLLIRQPKSHRFWTPAQPEPSQESEPDVISS